MLPSVDYEVHSPVRADETLGADEDLDRNPDGIPHAVVGWTALVAVVVACVLVAVLFAGMVSEVVAVGLAIIAVPWLVFRLRNKAERERDHVHPSR